MFDEYARFNLEANRATVGTGLGMAITNNLIKLVNGKIKVKSISGIGTTITIHVPQLEKTRREILKILTLPKKFTIKTLIFQLSLQRKKLTLLRKDRESTYLE